MSMPMPWSSGVAADVDAQNLDIQQLSNEALFHRAVLTNCTLYLCCSFNLQCCPTFLQVRVCAYTRLCRYDSNTRIY